TGKARSERDCKQGFHESSGRDDALVLKSVGRGKCDAFANLSDCLIDKADRLLAMAALVGRRGAELGTGVLQETDGGFHVRLRADGVTDTHAGRDDGPET